MSITRAHNLFPLLQNTPPSLLYEEGAGGLGLASRAPDWPQGHTLICYKALRKKINSVTAEQAKRQTDISQKGNAHRRQTHRKVINMVSN